MGHGNFSHVFFLKLSNVSSIEVMAQIYWNIRHAWCSTLLQLVALSFPILITSGGKIKINKGEHRSKKAEDEEHDMSRNNILKINKK